VDILISVEEGKSAKRENKAPNINNILKKNDTQKITATF
jgi:hypothetical protein